MNISLTQRSCHFPHFSPNIFPRLFQNTFSTIFLHLKLPPNFTPIFYLSLTLPLPSTLHFSPGFPKSVPHKHFQEFLPINIPPTLFSHCTKMRKKYLYFLVINNGLWGAHDRAAYLTLCSYYVICQGNEEMLCFFPN